MITQEIKKMIETSVLALASINKDNTPHLIAVAFVKILNGDLIITDNYMKTTIENIKRNNLVSLIVWNEKLEGYRIEGMASYFKDGKYKDFILNLEENKGEPCKGVLLVKVNKVIRLG